MSRAGTTGTYTIVSSPLMIRVKPGDHNLENEINLAERQGFSPIGPITIHGNMIYQLMGKNPIPSSGGGGRKSRSRKGYKKSMKKTRHRKL